MVDVKCMSFVVPRAEIVLSRSVKLCSRQTNNNKHTYKQTNKQEATSSKAKGKKRSVWVDRR